MRFDTSPRISICQFSTYQWTFVEDVMRYASQGFESIGIWRRKLDDLGLAQATDLLHENKMSVSSLHWAGGFTGDGQSFQLAIDDAIRSIEAANQLNANCLILHPGSRNGHTSSHAARLFHSALRELVPVAADYGVKLGLEPIPTKRNSPWTFLDSFNDTLEILERYSSRDLGLVLDLFHLGFDPLIFEQLEEIVDRIELVQLADRTMKDFECEQFQGRNETHRLPLGGGQIQFVNWFRKLQELGYAGQFEIEVHGNEVTDIDSFAFLDSVGEYFRSDQVESLLEVYPKRHQIKH